MRRVFWIALGATAGVLVVRKLTKTAESYTPEGVAKGLAGLGEGLREMAQVVREAMDERDAELRLALGVDEGAIDPARAQALIDHPTGEHAWATSGDADRASNPAHRAAGGRAR
ncbi:hypothetical protein [Angustibacter sp. Root456]|uniref:hypothetical protein n=1 Tax=Angustibacter sp. Root456 TaxID=1736539 RepID=UPI0006F569A0|nr:hypothetical protein [Angustibacter sp. Root456]KQX66725.1 hypothetical protein ASD06_05135 [Angustibacter sp. Root456]